MSARIAPATQGPLDERPAPGVPGRIYGAIDTLQLFRDNGIGWDEIVCGDGEVPAA